MRILGVYALLTLIGALVPGLCRLFRLKPVYPVIGKPKRSALCSIIAISMSMLIFFVLTLLAKKNGATQGTGQKHYQDLVEQLFVLFVYFLPMVLMLRLNGETLQSIGFTRKNLRKATGVGLLLAVTTLLFANGGPSAVFKFTENHNINSLIYCSFVGFGEEILFRGYLQNRLVAWLGHYKGWILASILFALAHVPSRVFAQGLDFPVALAYSLMPLFGGLFLGFVMLRTGSVVSGGLFHTFCDWVGTR